MSVILLGVYLLNLAIILYIIFRAKLSTEQIWAWVLVLLFMPVVGILLYILFGRQLSSKKIYNTKFQQELHEQIKKKIDNSKSEDVAEFIDIPKINELSRMMTISDDAIYTTNNNVKLIIDGIDKFDHVLNDIDHAKNYILLEYFCYEMDHIGTTIRNSLIKAAKRGVKIKILLDGWGSLGTKASFFNELKELGAEIAFFMPYMLQANYRNHRKIIVIDGKIGYLGGFNIGDSYIGLNPKMGYWRDNHLRIEGTAVYALTYRFLMDWNAEDRHHEPYKKEYFPDLAVEGKIAMQIVSSGPDSKDEQIKRVYLKMINLASEEILLQTPYYIPDDSIHEALKLALLSGVKVRLQIPNKPDHILVYWATYAKVAELLHYGAEIEIYQNGFMHAKTLIIDQKIASVGSANFDIRSLHLNFEINSVIYNEEFAKNLAKTFFQTSTQCQKLTLKEYEERSLLIKFKEGLARLIAPIL